MLHLPPSLPSTWTCVGQAPRSVTEPGAQTTSAGSFNMEELWLDSKPIQDELGPDIVSKEESSNTVVKLISSACRRDLILLVTTHSLISTHKGMNVD